MSQYACKLILIARRLDQARMNADITAWQRERVDMRIINNKKSELLFALISLRGDAVPDLVNVLGNLRVLDHRATATDVPHDGPANLRFSCLCKNRVGRTAHVRQPDVIRTGATDKHHGGYRDKEQGTFEALDNQRQVLEMLGLLIPTRIVSLCST